MSLSEESRQFYATEVDAALSRAEVFQEAEPERASMEVAKALTMSNLLLADAMVSQRQEAEQREAEERAFYAQVMDDDAGFQVMDDHYAYGSGFTYGSDS